MFGNLDDQFIPPAMELRNFTNRVSEQAAFDRLLELDGGHVAPVLMFYGVGGAGKTWLLRKLKQGLPANIPAAYLDLDRATGGVDYATNSARALAEIRRQLGDRVVCPRFDLAYTWLRFKEGNREEPLFRGAGSLGNIWELVQEVGSIAASKYPVAGLVKWVVGKVTSPVATWLKQSGIGQWLETQLGEEDFLNLKGMDPQGIYLELNQRLLRDLKANLPEQEGHTVRGVVFIDTVEAIRSERDSDAQLNRRHEWLQELYHPQSGLLVVMAGRDKLDWGADPNSDWAKDYYLEQHLVGGLSEHDAREFLTKCGVTQPPVQEAILRVSLDVETASQQDRGYHCFSLGLCADTCWTLRQRGETIDPDTFDMGPEETAKLAARFLRSLGSDGTYAQWLHALALTPRFDETAAREAFGPAGKEQDFAWQTLQSYSFLKPAEQTGWWTFHLRMREALNDLWQARHPEECQRQHQWWQKHWQQRSTAPTDGLAGLAWFHQWQLDPKSARRAWQDLAKEELRRLRVLNHAALLHWWTPCDLTSRLTDSDCRWEAAAALNSLGLEHWKSPQGNRNENLQRAIDCYNAALRVYTEQEFPQDWAMTQNNLGTAYQNLPTGDRGANLQRVIDCYHAALRVYTEQEFPQDWAMTQNNLGTAYCDLPTGDRGANLQRAIDCYTAALRVYTEQEFPQDWAMTQNNLGTAYCDLPTGDRGANLQRAIDCYTAALRVLHRTGVPAGLGDDAAQPRHRVQRPANGGRGRTCSGRSTVTTPPCGSLPKRSSRRTGR
ncbi:MAG: hypothetical protein R3C01_15620 [Planctomycetaceae bacterium]